MFLIICLMILILALIANHNAKSARDIRTANNRALELKIKTRRAARLNMAARVVSAHKRGLKNDIVLDNELKIYREMIEKERALKLNGFTYAK
jgi:predicted Holliday junction resolvase-like endonuclease